MGVYINGMKKAKRCIDCPFMVSRNNDDCILQSKEANEAFENWEQMRAGCPLVEVKEPHGRLIDADALFEEGADVCVGTYNALEEQGFSYAKIASMPTIIEAEGEDDG